MTRRVISRKFPIGPAMTASFTRTALVLLATSAVAACTTYPADGQGSMRPNYPTRLPPGAQAPATAPAAQTPPAPSDAPPVITVPPAAVTSRPLPPISSQPAPPAPSRPVEQTVTRQTATGRVVEAQGPAASYTVQRGDNLDAIARKLGTTRQQLADDNDLSPPYALRAGQVLKGPASQGRAYVVASGDTLSGIGRRFSVTAQQIAEANDMSVGAPLSVGQRLMLPEGISDRGAQTVTTRVPVTSGAPVAEVAAPPVREPEPAPATQTVTTTKTSVTGRVSDLTVPGETYTVKSGDNLEAIARKLDTTVKQLADDNDLKKPYRLQPGDKLKGPSTTAKAYTTVAGDTLELVARRFSVTARALAQANEMGTRDRLRAGRKLRLPEGYRDRGPVRETVRTVVAAPTPPAPTPAAPPPRQEPVRPAPVQPAPVQPAPTQAAPPPPPRQTPPPVTNYPRPTTPPPPPSSYPRPTTPSTPPIVPSAGPIPNDQISTLGRGRFQWPLRGDVMSEFGPKGVNQRNDGINIRTSTGTPVRSAADGDVVYAGDQVPGFGNLVLIKHADGWVTAYGHLSRVEVKMQQKVSQGQQIGLAGSSGGVSEPQLHFEVRYAPTPQDRARPIDPLLVLPR